MKTNAIIAGGGMTAFGKFPARTLKDLAGEAIKAALADAGLETADIEAAYMGNAAAGTITGQVCVPGEVVLRSLGIGGIPVINVENACATASTALNQAAAMVTAGLYDVVLAVGYEKLVHEDKARTFSVFSGAVDVTDMDGLAALVDGKMKAVGLEGDIAGAASRSLFMDIYATEAVAHMKAYGTTREQLAAVPAKNSRHGAHNPRAQFRDVTTVEEVLAAREIVWPLTLPMCSPIGDGAAAVLLVSERKARELGITDPVRITASVLGTSWDYPEGRESLVFHELIGRAYDEAGLGADDIDVVELHDASASSEILHTEYLGLCPVGEGGRVIEAGLTALGGGGRTVVNPSGGLLRKGHPIGATGIAQIVELYEQLSGRSGARQVEGARVGLAENGGGYINGDVAALCVTILER
ncbi:thiolase family protein [Novosphingobium taihuense]|uniref:Acetyl-CoA acetyltransferase n=1 Tax=Novosphingobium taihuense TaxID=260085 RepID=A0A7W7ACA6_9SPHN|nr:thiolase family protein [Novosphingobium taihuense]MBB4614394.1 acetyl-CoA acetyltransferase [Novosphingobium taihuense]TWH86363.1 acetyl-CoA acetyltransferase [Novosphingobium taihuense]